MAFTRTDARGETGAMRQGTRPEQSRANVTLADFTDCLLAAYDGVARRAYQKFVARGSRKGHEDHDWLEAERELGANLQVDLSESGKFVHAMVTLSGRRSAEVNVAVEGRWMMVLDAQEFVCQGEGAARLRAMEWDSVKGCAEVAAEWGRQSIAPIAWSANGAIDEELGSDDAEEREDMRLRWGSQPFCLVELPAEVEGKRSRCVVTNGILAMRMEKLAAPDL